VLGWLFAVVWIMRPQESAYGWFSLTSLAWLTYMINQVSAERWPFATIDASERFNSIVLLISAACLASFVARLCERRRQFIEIVLWVVVVIGTAAMACARHVYLHELRALLATATVCVSVFNCAALIRFALRNRHGDLALLALCMTGCVAAGVHDLFISLGASDDAVRYAVPASQLLTIGMAILLARRFTAALARADQFDDELASGIERAKRDVAMSLSDQHQLEVARVRIDERTGLAHDLHDGLGGMLVSHIAALEHAPHAMPAERCLGLLKALRDDLRIIIESATQPEPDEQPIDAWIAPLRHRLTQLLENQEIDCYWQVVCAADARMPASLGVDVMRILQEGVTNVLKHSRATRVDIELRNDDEHLGIVIADNGVGFDTTQAMSPQGVGLRSMRTRVARHGGTLTLSASGSATVLEVCIPIDRSAECTAPQL
jgi:signal transduction histidine kinase